MCLCKIITALFMGLWEAASGGCPEIGLSPFRSVSACVPGGALPSLRRPFAHQDLALAGAVGRAEQPFLFHALDQ
jgi:hypothetical protein